MHEDTSRLDLAAARAYAHECLRAGWTWVCAAMHSQEADYDVADAASHLRAIEHGISTFKRMPPSFLQLPSSSSTPLFELYLRACVGEGPRPDFHAGPHCCATAHEAAFVLLQTCMLFFERTLWDVNMNLSDLHKLNSVQLRNALSGLEQNNPIGGLIDVKDLRKLDVWINREWAAASRQEASLSPKGVSLRDAAARIRPDDSCGQTELCGQWRKSRNPKLPRSLGKDPMHAQRNLYAPKELLEFLREMEGESVDQDFGLSSHFKKVARPPSDRGDSI